MADQLDTQWIYDLRQQLDEEESEIATGACFITADRLACSGCAFLEGGLGQRRVCRMTGEIIFDYGEGPQPPTLTGELPV